MMRRRLGWRSATLPTCGSTVGTFIITGMLSRSAAGQTFPQGEVTQKGYATTPRGEFWEVALTDGQSIDPVVDLLRSRGLSIRHLVEKRQTLEDMFLETVVAAEPGVDTPVARRRRA